MGETCGIKLIPHVHVTHSGKNVKSASRLRLSNADGTRNGITLTDGKKRVENIWQASRRPSIRSGSVPKLFGRWRIVGW